MRPKKRLDSGLKIAVALDALKGGKTLREIAAEHGVHPAQVSAWKRMFRQCLESIFSGGAVARKPRSSLLAENLWMKEKLAGLDLEARRGLIEYSESPLSLRKQCSLLGLTRSSLYYRKKSERPENLELMAKIREIASRSPDFGVLRMTKALRDSGRIVNQKRVRRLMRKLALCLAFLQYSSIPSMFHHFHKLARFH